MDTLSRLERSKVMSRIRSNGNASTELAMVALLRREKLGGWRRRHRMLGKPDFVFLKKKVAVFVDGCFWHGHPKRCRIPAANQQYWVSKISRNKKRDRAVNEKLREMGWTVVRVWEHEVESKKVLKLLRRLLHSPPNG